MVPTLLGMFGCVVLGLLLNAVFPLPRGPVPGKDATLSTVSHSYMEALEHQDCGLTRALSIPGRVGWCGDPRLISYERQDTSGDEGQCVDYLITITDSSDASMRAGTEPWSLCFEQTKDGWRLYDQGQG